MTQHRLPGWLIGLFVATLALGTDEFVIAGLLPELAADLQITTGTAGQLITVFALTFALGAPVMAVVLDPYPRRRVILTALAVFMLANLGAAIAPTFSSLIALRAVAGLAAAVVSSTAFAVAAQGAPSDRQGRYLSVVTAGLTVALFTGVPVGAWIGGLFGWRSTFVLIAVVALAAMIVLAAGLPQLEGAPAAGLVERLSPLRNVRVLRLVLAVTLCGAGGLMFYSYLSALLERSQGNTQALPWVLLLVGIIGVPSAFLGGRLADQYGGRRSRLIVVGGHAFALVLVGSLIALSAPFPLLLLGIAAWSVFAWALNPPLQASTIEAAPEAPMTAISLNISGLYLGTAAAAGVGGIIVDGPGALWVPFAAALALTLAWISASFRTPQPAAVTA
ncbi:MFS transporter [Streptomyces sp. NBRC 109706]|uniref:MFS transporter n=1 Tax=Streptomyces sp. NBRC 109706 TaxID=1550035 RepID=UPI00099C3FED|nr:MFS transporter [Streptomyces sp. NBRC 109706]